MESQRATFIHPGLMACLGLLLSCIVAHAQDNKYACSEHDPQSLCNASNTCGSFFKPCTVDVKRDDYGSSATPDIPNAKGNSTFCVNTGTTIVWKSTQKNMGFVVDFGPSSPFGSQDAIVGGARHSVSVTAMEPGCYKYSAGACISGALPGMCGSVMAEAIIIATGSP
jgi:plastocyanin